MKMIYYNCYVIVLLLLIINVSSLTVMKGKTISNETSEINDLLNEIERSIVKKERMKRKKMKRWKMQIMRTMKTQFHLSSLFFLVLALD